MNRATVIAVILVMLAISCSKTKIYTDASKTSIGLYEIAIEGGLNTFNKKQFIRLRKPAIYPNKAVQPATQAMVSISDGLNKVLFQETDTPGVYSGLINDNQNYEQPYTLTVYYNKIRYVAFDTLKKVSSFNKNDLPFYVQKLTNGQVKLNIPKHTFNSVTSSKWFIEYPGKIKWEPGFSKNLDYSYSYQKGSPNTLYPGIQKITSIVLNPGDTVRVYKFSLSDVYSNYLYNVFQETDFKNIFSSTPGKIYGNVSDNGLGFFSTTDVTIKQFLAADLVNQ